MNKEILKRKKALIEFIPTVNKFLTQTQNKTNLKISKKSTIDLVTEADKGSEKRITGFLKKNFPEDSLLGEEGSAYDGKNQWKWIIDPLDGTTNYAHGLPLYAVSIGLENRETGLIEMGLISIPSLGDLYHAIRNGGAFKNNKKIHVTNTDLLINSLMCTGFPYTPENEMPVLLNRLKSFLLKGRGLRRTGAAALDLAWLAEGRFDIFWEDMLNPWDLAAGFLLIEEAGGKVTDFKGNTFNPYISNILATNGILHEEAVKVLKASSKKK
ncbi:MAG: inositol monophosphatase [Leptospiraceae bacterium]|nr:inositol monophosphatase [Leptospiraceae bacterium]MCP5510502.1 inositol monophosphatase [Leptospiraceae bacterium]